MKKLYFIFVLLLSSLHLWAQSADDMLRYSRINYYGTARSAAMGGAFGALGGDLSTLHTNPAGLGVYRKGEINFTPLFNFNHNEADNYNSKKNSFQIGNLGGLISIYNPKYKWKGFNFGINYTQLNNFNRSVFQQVEQSEYSRLEVYANDSKSLHSSDLGWAGALAYDAYLMNPDGAGNYIPTFEPGSDLMNQELSIKERGYQGEYAFSFGTNYMEKFYMGFTLGLQTIYHKKESRYTEKAITNTYDLDYYTTIEYEKIRGNGFNFKFGFIYRPIPQLRIGASIHTPTWYALDHDFRMGIYADYATDYDNLTGREDKTYEIHTRPAQESYDMKTPWRTTFSLAGVLAQRTIISLDYEFIHYKSAEYSNSVDLDSYLYLINQEIKNTYQNTHNIKIGAEYRLSSVFSLRGGYTWAQNPFKHSDIYKVISFVPGGNELQSLSTGFGINFGRVYCDAAYIYQWGKDDTIFYYYDNGEPEEYFTAAPIANKYRNHQARVSVGFRF